MDDLSTELGVDSSLTFANGVALTEAGGDGLYEDGAGEAKDGV